MAGFPVASVGTGRHFHCIPGLTYLYWRDVFWERESVDWTEDCHRDIRTAAVSAIARHFLSRTCGGKRARVGTTSDVLGMDKQPKCCARLRGVHCTTWSSQGRGAGFWTPVFVGLY